MTTIEKEVQRYRNAFNNNNCTSFAFWPYDRYPHVLCSPVKDVTVRADCSIRAASPLFGGLIAPQYLENDAEVALKIKEKLDVLEAEYEQAQRELAAKYRNKALAVAPFLKKFPAYK